MLLYRRLHLFGHEKEQAAYLLGSANHGTPDNAPRKGRFTAMQHLIDGMGSLGMIDLDRVQIFGITLSD